MQSYLKINNLSLAFGKQIIFNDASLEITRPGLYFLMGRNGCGKTTLFKTILNEVNYHGNIEIIGGNDNVSYCMADPEVFENLTVYENLKLIVSNDDKIKELADIFGISSILNDNVSKCSAGEKQRICIIRAIIEDKPIILLDEATSHLDDINSNKALDYIKKLSKNHVIIYSSHYEHDALKYADAYIRIIDEKIILEENNLIDDKVIIKEKENYYPKKLFRKIIFWKKDYLFSLLFAIMIIVTLVFSYLLYLTPTKVYKEYQNESCNIEYNVIDDANSNPYTTSEKTYTTSNNNNEFVEDFLTRNKKLNKGIKNITLYLKVDNDKTSLNIDYVLFDEKVPDDTIYLTNYLYKSAKNSGFITNDSFVFNDVNFNVQVLKGNYFCDYYVSNELTFKKMMKLNKMCTTSNTNVNLCSGSLPANDDEIILYFNDFDGIRGDYDTRYDKENMTFTLTVYNVSKTFKIVGFYDSVTYQKYGFTPSYLLTDSGYNFVYEDNVYDFGRLYVIYGNSSDLTTSDYKYLIKNSMYLNNDVTQYSYGAYQYFKTLRRPIIISIIFIVTFDILIILFYLSYYKNENSKKISLLKVLKKNDFVKKDYTYFKIILNIVTFVVAILAFTISEFIINISLKEGTLMYLDNVSSLTINYYFNGFLFYMLPLILIIQAAICFKQIRSIRK